MPAAHAERHPEALADSRGLPISPSCYGGGYTPCHHARQSADPGDPAQEHRVALIEGIQDLGLCSRGSGADNIRNVTGTPTAGIDPQELLDTRPYAREWHFHILNDRSLYGLPRKFNVAFDGAGRIAVLEETNDIAFSAVEVKDGYGVEPGIWFRLGIGGITGHRDFAQGNRDRRQAGGRDEGGGRHRARVHRYRRPHQPPEGAAEIRARRHRRRQVHACCRRKARPQADARAGRSDCGRVRPSTAWRISASHAAEAGGIELDRRRAAGRQAHSRADARAWRRLRGTSATARSG